MQVQETSAEGLKRKLTVTIKADELGERFTERLGKIKDQVQLKGFRKGKVPPAHIKKVYGRSLMSEVLEETIRETSRKAIADRNERPAMMPDIKLAEGQTDIERVMAGEGDLAYEMSFEVLPKIKIADLTALKLERLVADVDEEAIEKAIGNLADSNQTFVAEEGRKAAEGDRVTIDYKGTINGETFEGGVGEGLSLVIGSANFIPGFEEGLKGATKGEQREVKGTFPAEYPVAELAGKDAVFAVTVNEVERPEKPEINDEWAKKMGVESLDKLKEIVSGGIQQEYAMAGRSKLKRELLDALERAHDFELPPSLVEREFEGIWRQLEESRKQGKDTADEGKSDDELKAEYRKIAERRVRLGLVVGEIGDANKIDVSQDELRRALMEQARRFPGQEKRVYEYFEKTPGALAELRAPIFEDKVIDFIIDQAKPIERKVSREELTKRVEEVTAS